MTRLKNFKWAILILVLHLIIVGYFAVKLPLDAKVPMHWNIHNEIDGWTSRTMGLLFFPALNVGMFFLFVLMPWYSPWYRKFEERFERVLPSLTTTLLLFFSLLSVYSLYIALAGEIPGIRFIMILIGLLFIFLGNILPKVPKNFFIGIKTPWTLSSDLVWEKTHRMGGLLFVLVGLLMIVKGVILIDHSGFQKASAVVALGMLLYPLLYSFIVYKAVEKE
ncbi:MAG: SdpI family protein [Candidatus Cloacimonadaceae bacterium]|nr:SdpI family protein [Candidatus Cloacimonadaceae bacterium]